MHDSWWEFGDWSDSLELNVAQVDITENPGLSGRFMVTALPTIYHVKNGVFRQYHGARDRDSFISFVEQKKWTQIKPISTWKDPNSLQMSVVSKFFQWSYQIRAIHTYLVDQGIPYWASYGLFAFATIVIGAVLGLIIVACIDHVFPGKSLEYQRMDDTSVQENSDLEEEEPTWEVAKNDRGDVKDQEDSKGAKKKSKKID
ncbi:thioredoxin-related transmembrane protein 1-like [Tropilaelaps mercedesae]|uniref:Thioredoxin-related transmembrane protein 1-like n=1 Tax=Tropilaelaps mercedesae TaxID=418985 RepID=A0A1V9XFF8_9ACAR|nr:thioredoxin-related transmembrane protein 1-like [Tropilaelaps mercedesae]